MTLRSLPPHASATWTCGPFSPPPPRLDAVVLEPGDTAPFALRARALDETVLVKRFLDLETGRAFCAAVTHLYYHPRHPDLKVCCMRCRAPWLWMCKQ